MQDLPKHLLNP